MIKRKSEQMFSFTFFVLMVLFLKRSWKTVSLGDKGKSMDKKNDVMLSRAKYGCSESFDKVFEKYVPIVLKQRNAYYLKGYDLDDWLQEGRIVCFQSLQKYNMTQDITFGLFFKINFKRHIISLLRRQEAKKRQIDRHTESLEAQVDHLGEQFSKYNKDERAETSIQYIFVRETLEDFSNQLSKFETQIYIYVLLGKSFDEIASLMEVPSKKVKGGFNRLKMKIKNQVLD